MMRCSMAIQRTGLPLCPEGSRLPFALRRCLLCVSRNEGHLAGFSSPCGRERSPLPREWGRETRTCPLGVLVQLCCFSSPMRTVPWASGSGMPAQWQAESPHVSDRPAAPLPDFQGSTGSPLLFLFFWLFQWEPGGTCLGRDHQYHLCVRISALPDVLLILLLKFSATRIS